MPMHEPPHPGRIVRQECLVPLGLSVTEAARVLGVTRQALNNLVNGKSGVSPEMPVRLAKAFGGGAETWLRLQGASTTSPRSGGAPTRSGSSAITRRRPNPDFSVRREGAVHQWRKDPPRELSVRSGS
jgi:antitoxin HigA-1